MSGVKRLEKNVRLENKRKTKEKQKKNNNQKTYPRLPFGIVVYTFGQAFSKQLQCTYHCWPSPEGTPDKGGNCKEPSNSSLFSPSR